MSPVLASMGIDRLNRDQKLVLVQEIWKSIAAEGDSLFLSDSQRQELLKRAEEDDLYPDNVTPWEQVRARTLARWQHSH